MCGMCAHVIKCVIVYLFDVCGVCGVCVHVCGTCACMIVWYVCLYDSVCDGVHI